MPDRRKTTKKTIIWIAVLMVFELVALCLVLLIVFGKNRSDTENKDTTETNIDSRTETIDLMKSEEKTDEISTDKIAEEKNTEAETATNTENEEAVINEVVVPEKIANLLESVGVDKEYLSETGAEQLVVVEGQGTEARLSYYSLVDGVWEEDESLSCNGFVGIEGTVNEMSEQVSGTPRGLYPVGSAFYQDEAPETGLSSFVITPDTYWVDDPDSRYYNQRIEGAENIDWNSAEHMADIPEYKYGFVINYNMPAEYNKGSAIFFHVGYGPTVGCVATSENMVLEYLKRLDDNKTPYIIIV